MGQLNDSHSDLYRRSVVRATGLVYICMYINFFFFFFRTELFHCFFSFLVFPFHQGVSPVSYLGEIQAK